ncbi:MAG: hypothetical protein K8R23_02510 [Chthoniobacter sp.]|nr:hypothetical protein [Chthoniobacter sp.]
MSDTTKPQEKPKCFIAMPVSTPDHLIKEYGDPDHFKHVMEELFLPAIEAAGMIAIPPISTGSEVIHADIVDALQSAELVLVDLSSLNPNVLFEFGVRTSLNKPACPVRDDKTPTIPFDASTLNTHNYSSDLQSWITKREIPKLTTHLQASLEKSNGQNALWKHFGFKQSAAAPREPKGPEEKLDAVMTELAGLRSQVQRIENTGVATPAGTAALQPLIDRQAMLIDQRRQMAAIIADHLVKVGGDFASLDRTAILAEFQNARTNAGQPIVFPPPVLFNQTIALMKKTIESPPPSHGG